MAEELIFELKKCKGKIFYKDFSLDLEFILSCKQNGHISIIPKRIPISNQSKFLFDIEDSKDILVKTFSIIGESENSIQIKSDYTYLVGCGTPSDKSGSYFDIVISTNQLLVSWEVQGDEDESLESLQIEYLVQGLQCFGHVSTEAPFGNVNIAGCTKPTDYDLLSGRVLVDAPLSETSLSPDQIEIIDSGVRRLLDILSLAEGRFMKWSRRQIRLGGRLHSALFRGPMSSSKPIFPLFSFLHLDPIVTLAIERYTKELCEKTGIDVAIEWFLMHPRYTEAEFLTGMTALEHLIHVFVEKNPKSGNLPKSFFKKNVRPCIEAALKEVIQSLPLKSKSDEQEVLRVMSQNIGKLNQRSLRTNLEDLIAYYTVPVLDLKDEIRTLINLRNDIVHRGHMEESNHPKPLPYYVAVLREILTRIFLSILHYKGEYQSYLGGPEWRQFPPTDNISD